MESLQTNSILIRIIAVIVMVLTAFVPLSAAVRIVMAPFSQRVRDSIMRHKLVHVVWFVGAVVIAFFLLAPFLFTAKTKGL